MKSLAININFKKLPYNEILGEINYIQCDISWNSEFDESYVETEPRISDYPKHQEIEPKYTKSKLLRILLKWKF